LNTAAASKDDNPNPGHPLGGLLPRARDSRPRAASTLVREGIHSLVPSLLIFSLTLTGCTALIEWGWDEPDQAFLKTHITTMERKPFDGVVLHLTVPGVPPGVSNFSWHLDDHRYQWHEILPAVEELKAVPFRRFRHNFLRINLNPGNGPLDMLDDQTWETVFANLRLAARTVREAGLKGFMLDPEAYARPDPTSGRPRFNVFDYGRRAVREASLDVYRSAAFKRGREAAAILGSTAPDLVLLFAFAYTFPCGSPTRAADGGYGLLPAFLDGILVAKPPNMVVIEGHESSYPLRYCPQFQEAYRRLRVECRRLSLVPDRYDRDLRIAFAIWMDNESGSYCASYRKEGKPCPWTDPNLYPVEARHQVDPHDFEGAVASALDLTDRYVWIYSEEPKWWTPSRPDGENLPAEFVEAIERARSAFAARRGSLCQKPPLND